MVLGILYRFPRPLPGFLIESVGEAKLGTNTIEPWSSSCKCVQKLSGCDSNTK